MTGRTGSFVARATAAAIAVSLAACSGGGTGSNSLPSTGGSQTPTTTQQSAKAQMVIKIPAKTTTLSLKPKYISASTQSLTVGLLSGTNATQIAEADLTPTSPNCSAVTGGGTQCTVSLVGNAGANTFVVKMYDQTGGKGNLLSTGNVAATLSAGQNTTVPVVLDAVPASVSLVLGTSTLPVGAAGSTSVTVQALDADGNIIVGPGGFTTPVSLAIGSDTYKTLSLSSATVKSPGQVVTLSYNGGSNVGSTITPSLGATAGTPATFNATGASLSIFNFSDPADGFTYNYPYGVAALPNGNAVIEQRGSSNFLEVASPNGTQAAFIGDVTDPYGTAPTPPSYKNITVVSGMSANLAEWQGEQDHEMAVGSNGLVYYGASETSTHDTTNCSGGTSTFGAIGAFDPVAHTASEKYLKGEPMFIQGDASGNVWFIEQTGGCHTASGTTLYFPSRYAIGKLTAGGTVTETDLGSTGFPSTDQPSAMSISADGSKMYVGDWNSGSIYSIPTASLAGATAITPPNSKYATSLATAPDGTTLWFSYTDPGDYYYYGFLPSGATFSPTSILEDTFPITYFYSYDATYADGSFWIPGAEYGTGLGRISGLSSANHPIVNYYQLPYPDGDGQALASISAGGGYIWAGDDDYGNIDVYQYGTPSSATVTYSAAVRRKPALSMPKNPHPHALSTPIGKHSAQ